ncbi:uncharacterized protein LOC134690625 [Mytilus trossulus]|uniref:uncharacterized protein LOC134690625 n=1 Tax=Mytilus trossulus TaxID=6551 RepID=UPI003004E70D
MVVLDPSSDQMLAMDILAFDKMKGNRRKQSKPIRVSCSADSESVEPGSKYLGISESQFPNNGNNDMNDAENRPSEESDSSDVRMDRNIIEKELDMHRKLKENEMIENNNKLLSSFHSIPGSEGYPTKYHRLGSELFQPAFPTNGERESERPDPTRINGEDRFKDMLEKTPNSDEEGKKVDGGNRIFHQDAYCEICDREFCNKYFLKTHRANKHGIFDNSTSPISSMGPSMPLPQDIITTASPIQPPTLTTSSSFKVMDFIQNLPATEPKSKQPDTPKPPQNMEAKSPLMPNPPSTPTTPGGSINNNSANVSNGSKPVPKDMEDFCELCQKHFCNKYYLKKHKQDVHGIAPPDGLSSANKRGRPKDLQAQLDAITSSTMSLGNPTISSSMSSFMPPHSLPNMPGLPNMPPGVMVLNPFMAPMLLHAGGLMPQQGQMPTPPIMSQLPPTSPTPPPMPSHSSANTPPPSSVSSTGQIPIGSNGALNQEAYCDLCQKEFCNKYFLKIHKANKHGIFFDDFPFGPPIPPYKMPIFSDNKPTSEKSESPNDANNIKQENSPKAGTSMITSSPENPGTYCNLCNQEFASKYTYRIHRIQVHGMLNEAYEGALMEDIMKSTMKDRIESQMKISPNSLAKMEMDEYFNNRMMENGMSTMFSNMVAAKLADRVTCDICNKVLCNKYFLKVHKQKVHGIEPSPEQDLKLDISKAFQMNGSEPSTPIKSAMKFEPSDPSPKLPTSMGASFPMGYPRASEALLDMSPNSVEKPSKDELVKMGIDPEAYCEICKKEFCSKYFLRTHKLNIHGIRGDKPETPDSDKLAFLNMSLSQASMSMNQTNLSASMGAMSGAMSQNNKPLNLSMNTNGKSSKSVYEKHSWRWKEPVNSSRVICELCNKEVCNKYFLRTHKLNKHGILPSETSLSPSSSPYPSEFDTQSNSSLPTDLSMRERNQSPLAVHLGSNVSRPSSIYGYEQKRDSENMMNDNENSEYYNSYSEVCQLCEKRFKNLKRLKLHIMKDHGMLSSVRKGLFSESQMDNRICRMCDASFPNELAMHLHMIQEHNAQVSLNTNENERENMPPVSRPRKHKSRLGFHKLSLITKQKYYSCSKCDFRSKWLNNLCDHELKVHNISPKNGQSFGNIHVNSPTKIGKYRCSKCSRKFPSIILCNRHIREEHIRKKDFAIVKSNTRYSCEHCKFSTRFSKQLKRHVERVHSGTEERLNGLDMEDNYSGKTSEPLNLHVQAVNGSGSDCEMQAFKIKDCSSIYSDFVTTVVKMPVRHHVSAPITVTFHLTPMEQ